MASQLLCPDRWGAVTLSSCGTNLFNFNRHCFGRVGHCLLTSTFYAHSHVLRHYSVCTICTRLYAQTAYNFVNTLNWLTIPLPTTIMLILYMYKCLYMYFVTRDYVLVRFVNLLSGLLRTNSQLIRYLSRPLSVMSPCRMAWRQIRFWSTPTNWRT